MRRGATFTSLRMSAAISPAFSATPTPAIATNVTATTAKPAKLLTNDEKMNRMPSTLSRLCTSNVCSWIDVVGHVEDLAGLGVVRHDRAAELHR